MPLQRKWLLLCLAILTIEAQKGISLGKALDFSQDGKAEKCNLENNGETLTTPLKSLCILCCTYANVHLLIF